MEKKSKKITFTNKYMIYNFFFFDYFVIDWLIVYYWMFFVVVEWMIEIYTLVTWFSHDIDQRDKYYWM